MWNVACVLQAELITEQRFTTLDLERFSFDRVGHLCPRSICLSIALNIPEVFAYLSALCATSVSAPEAFGYLSTRPLWFAELF